MNDNNVNENENINVTQTSFNEEVESHSNNVTSNNNSKKSNKIFIIVVLILLVIIIVALILFLMGQNNNSNIDNNFSTPSDDKIVPTISDDEKQKYQDYFSSDEGLNTSYKLYVCATDLLTDEKYKKLNINDSGVYYATKEDLINYGYDVSFLSDKCTDDMPIIYFDVNRILNNSYDNEPILYNIFCE